MRIDPRFLQEEGDEVFTGNELLIKGALEAEGGTHLLTGYPGSPIAGFFDAMELIAPLLKGKGIRACISNNEALGAAMLNGSQMGPLRGLCAMKSVGLHVAADALALGNLAGAHPEGGALVIIGDDPWSDSTQVPADSRYLCKHIFMPVIEPSSMQELKDWIDIGYRLSREANLFLGYLVTTNQVDGGGSVRVRPNNFPDVSTASKFNLDTARIDLDNTVLLPPRTWSREANFPTRYGRLLEAARRYGVNRILNSRQNPRWRAEIGFVSTGLGLSYLQHALAELGVADQVPILKLGISHPVDQPLVVEFAKQVRGIFVIEERRGFMEEQIAEIVNKLNQNATAANRTNVWGKEFPAGLKGIPQTRGLNPSILIERLAPLGKFFHDPNLNIDPARIECAVELMHETESFDIKIPPRTPTFCPGCPHRDSASVLMEIKKQFMDAHYMKRRHHRGPVDLLFHGDTGCYTMLMFEPTKDLMHNYSGMGLGGGTGAGIDPFITNKQVVFLGDSTFFHSGMLGISNSLKQGQDITYVILDNQTTAMTGHQPTPSMDVDIVGEHTYAQNIDGIVEAMLGQGVHVVRANPAYRETWRRMLEETVLRDGVKVIIADKECGITYHRRESRQQRAEIKEHGFLREKRFVNINPDVCEFCLECTVATGCPGLTIVDTPLGAKIQTDLSWCVADTACTKIYACPSFEEITVVRSQKPPAPIDQVDLSNLPLPATRGFDNAWRCHLAGVGGQGIGVCTATIVRAGFKQGYNVLFCDKKGLAIRNGGVYSQVIFTKAANTGASVLIPYGQADVVIGVDPLEAVRSLDPAGNLRVGSPGRTSAVVNLFKTPTIMTLLGKHDFDLRELDTKMQRYTRSEDYFGLNIAGISEHFFGTKLYANVVMLGVAFQRGLLPLSLANIEWGLRETMGSAAEENIKAFYLGRKLVIEPELAHKHELHESYEQFIAERMEVLKRNHRWGKRWAREFDELVKHSERSIQLGEQVKRDLVWRLYDLVEFGTGNYARRYLQLVERVYAQDSADAGYAATKAVIWNLHKAMIVKDEVYVAHLLTSEEKTRRDNHRYHVDPERGDKIIYHHLNRPEFNVLGRDIRFKFSPKKWMLNLMKHMRWLRIAMPAWHRREREFRDWYIRLVENFRNVYGQAGYDRYVQALRCVEEVRGYREIRYPSMDEARRKVETMLAKPAATVPQHVTV
jgi:indolepyruvate ferredoxin oxidoreductase